MRQLIMWNLVTLDGYFEGPKPWDIEWHNYIWGEELEQLSLEQAKSIGMLLFGRRTYEGMAAYWSSAEGDIAVFMNTVPKVVFSRTLETAGWKNTRLVTNDAAEEVAKLKQGDGKDLFIFGSADLSAALARHGLIDEYRLALTPLVLGEGNPLFKPSPHRLTLRLLEARPLKSGGVILRYQPAKDR
ncbi:MAG TPA: dihydrofolate reductase family protein [bacterium]|nr:dihydrofolate reductase family protein [bacterium]